MDFREADLAYGNLSADFSNAINYNIDIALNDVKKAIFTFPEVVSLLDHFEIQIKDFP